MIVKAVGLTSEEVRPRRSTSVPRRFPQPVPPLNCLVITGDGRARGQLRLASAQDRHFRCDARDWCDAPSSAVADDHHLVLVDLRYLFGAVLRDAMRLVARHAGRCACLLVVCGGDDTGAEERWARQLGVDLYFPCMPVVDAVNLVVADMTRDCVAAA
ncbi:MAG: hypothetical protein K8S94_05455 [Planctomycetia bacterium]|nr:hypothetical protein [Planctomycetia bacterium]